MRRSVALVLAAVAMLAVVTPLFAQAQVVRATPQTQYRYNPMGQSLNWLFYPQIQKELEIVAEQKEKLTAIRTDMQTKMRDMYKSLRDVDAGERQKKYYEVYKELGDETDKKVREVLLGHQADRLRQIILQRKLQGSGYGAAGMLTGDDIAKALGITDEQKEQLRKKETEIRQDMQKKSQEFYKKLREEARDELLGVLSDSQRRSLEAMMGETYEWQPMQWRGGQGGTVGGVRIEKKQ